MIEPLEARGRKEICRLLGYTHWASCKSRIKEIERATKVILLRYYKGRPVLSVPAFKAISLLMANTGGKKG